MKKTTVVSLVLIPFLTLILVGSFLILTTTGLVVLKNGANSLLGNVVSIGSVEGRLGGNFLLEDMHISTSVADIEIGQFEWDWHPFALFQRTLDITSCRTANVSIQLKPTDAQDQQDPETKNSLSLPATVLPFILRLNDLSLQDIKLKGAEGKLLFELFSLNTSMQIHKDLLVVESFAAEAPGLGLAFHGNVETFKDWDLDLMGTWHLNGYGFHPSKGTFAFTGPLANPGVTATLVDPADIRVKGVVHNLLESPTWTADLDAKNVNLYTWIYHCPEIILESVHGDMSGDFGHYRGLVVADGKWGVADKLHLRSNIDGNGLGIIFNSLRIDRDKGSAVATNGSISWAKLFSWEADLQVNDFALAMFFPDFDGTASSRFHSVGDVTEKGLEASFDLETMQGVFSGYAWSATGKIGLTESGIFSDDLQLHSEDVGGLAIVRNAGLFWEDKLSWKASVDLDGFDPSFINPELSGKISGNIISELQWPESVPAGFLEISDLSGTLKGHVLSGGGNIAIDGGVLSSSGLRVNLGRSQLLLSGVVEKELGLQFAVTSADLSELNKDIFGELDLRGHLAGSKEEPRVDVQFSGKNLILPQTEMKGLSGHLKVSLAPNGIVEGQVKIDDGLLGGADISSARFDISGTREEHTLQSNVTGADGDLAFVLEGKYHEGWQGKLSAFVLKTTGFGSWQQVDGSAVDFSQERLEVKQFCLESTVDSADGTLCLAGVLNQNDTPEWSITADLKAFQLKQLSSMDLGFPVITGRLDVNLEAAGDLEEVRLATVTASLPQLNTLLEVADSDYVTFQLSDSSLTAKLENEQLALDLFFRAEKGGTLRLAGQVGNIGRFDRPLSASTIVGNLTLDKYYLNHLAAFTGYGVETMGWVSSSLTLAGTLGKPEIYGEIALQEGGLELPYQGITLDNVKLAISGNDSGAIVRGSASSGDGQMNVYGHIDEGEDGVEAVLKLEGKNFLLVDLPEYSFKVNPHAELTLNKNKGQINGQVSVVSGLIAPEELSEALKVSEDVVIIDEDKVHVSKGYPFYLDLDVALGDQVKVDGYGLNGRLAGNLNVKITPEEFITGRGELDLLDSTFSFYGRSLDIARGRILFTGGPIDNPGVDIRAQKVVTAETARDDEYTVGVDINGLVQNLQYHLFSDPYMEDTDILSQMVVGHSFASSSQAESSLLEAAATTLGLAGSSKIMDGLERLLFIDDLHLEGSTKAQDVSLVVGKRITEDLYIGYDMNMFSQLGQFRVRYDLSRGFYVETRSSSESTGADLIYSFER
jgi:translocation and assembly module TamB